MPEFELVAQPASLAQALGDCERAGVDTEFMREKTYFAELCLVQVATTGGIFCVDPLAGAPMAEFWGALLQTPWVLHSGRQDIEVVYQTAGSLPASVFDTQVAAGLLGHAPQMGYAALVTELFGVDIDKTHTRADWSRRPLQEAYLHYAAEDVEYLLPACDLLSEQLERQGRLGWAREDSTLLLDTTLYDIGPDAAFDRLKGGRNLRGRGRAVAARLAAWREAEALRANRPRQWIVRDPVLVELARRQPATVEELERIDGLSRGLIRRSGMRLVDAIAGADGDGAGLPRPPDESQRSLLKTMQKKVASRAAELGVAAEVVASKRELTAVIVGGERDARVLSGWRRDVIGAELLGLL